MSKNKIAFIISALVLIICLSLLFLPEHQSGTLAKVQIEGKAVLSIDLKNSEDKIISLQEFGKNVELEIKNHKIRFYSSDCPNKTCVNTGFIGKIGETAVCLPNKTAVTIITDTK